MPQVSLISENEFQLGTNYVTVLVPGGEYFECVAANNMEAKLTEIAWMTWATSGSVDVWNASASLMPPRLMEWKTFLCCSFALWNWKLDFRQLIAIKNFGWACGALNLWHVNSIRVEISLIHTLEVLKRGFMVYGAGKLIKYLLNAFWLTNFQDENFLKI